MAACGSLESPSPWEHIKFAGPIDECHKGSSVHQSSLSNFWADLHSSHQETNISNDNASSMYCPSTHQNKYAECFTSPELSLCTEGLGFESFDDVWNNDCQHQEERKSSRKDMHSKNYYNCKRSRILSKGTLFPPPISCIGKNGQPLVCFQAYRQDGRFILKEIRIQTREFLHSCRENGCLKVQLVQADDDEGQSEDLGNNNHSDDEDCVKNYGDGEEQDNVGTS